MKNQEEITSVPSSRPLRAGFSVFYFLYLNFCRLRSIPTIFRIPFSLSVVPFPFICLFLNLKEIEIIRKLISINKDIQAFAVTPKADFDAISYKPYQFDHPQMCQKETPFLYTVLHLAQNIRADDK